MPVGKLGPEELKERVLRYRGADRREVLVGGAVGEDAAVLDLGADLCVVSTDPITGAANEVGSLAVVVSCNDVATSGAEPVAAALTLIAPPGTRLEEMEAVMADADHAATRLGVAIVAGHTERSSAVNQVVVSCTVLGRVPASGLLASHRVHPGASLVMVRWAGVEGTAIMARDHAPRLQGVLTPEEIRDARGFAREVSVLEPCRIARKHGALFMHDVTEGGVLGAAYEMAQATGLGLDLTAHIAVHPLTRKLCAGLGLDPLRLISSGTLLVAAEEADALHRALREAGFFSQPIGTFTEEGAGVRWGGRPLDPPEGDELWTFLARTEKDQ
jgi:hydrogenase expression/formation protein HypE